jgi:hypothetical protein
LRGRQLLDARFTKATTEGKITASVTTSQDELAPVSMIVRNIALAGTYKIRFVVDGANYKQLPPLFAHAACVAIELTLDDSERAWVVLSLCNEALWDELSERLVKVLSIHRNVVDACLDDGDVEWGRWGNPTLSPELRAAIENNVCRPSQLKARVDAYVDVWVQLVRQQLDLVFPLESEPAPFETAAEFVEALVEAGPAAAVDVPSTRKQQRLRVPRSGAGRGLCGNQIYGAFILNRRVDLHAIDATPARWRGDVGSSPLDGASAATSSPRNDLVKNYRVHPTHW